LSSAFVIEPSMCDAAQHEAHYQDREGEERERHQPGPGGSRPAAALQAIDDHTGHSADHEAGDERVDDARGLLEQPDRADEDQDHPHHEPDADAPLLKPGRKGKTDLSTPSC
jgi:hypothetical protein